MTHFESVRPDETPQAMRCIICGCLFTPPQPLEGMAPGDYRLSHCPDKCLAPAMAAKEQRDECRKSRREAQAAAAEEDKWRYLCACGSLAECTEWRAAFEEATDV